MAIRERVNAVLADWCGEDQPNQANGLEALWTSTQDDPERPHHGVPFQPDGVGDLLAKLDREFAKPGEVLKDISSLTVNSFQPNGNINSVDDLVAIVRGASMSIRKRVNLVLSDWCGEPPNRINQAISLDVLWTATRNNPDRPHNGVAFQAEGVVDLLGRLDSEFTKPGSVRKRISVLRPNSFKPNGNIDSVDNLVEGVVGCPNLPPMAEGDEL
jgi:hypothetical protein